MGCRIILGIDEVGRGPYAGPLVVGAVILPEDQSETLPGADHPWISDLKDSKKLTPKKRELLSAVIRQNAAAAETGWVTSAELDKYGMTKSLMLAARRAVKKILAEKVPFSEIVVDGTMNFLAGTPFESRTTFMPKADDKVREVSAASIIAKTARDAYMVKLAKKYPGYSFEKNMGYGTAAHEAAIREIGITPEHRTSFAPVSRAIDKGVKLNFGLDGVSAPKIDPKLSEKEIRKDFEAAVLELNKKTRGGASKKTADAGKPETSKAAGDRAETIVAARLAAEGHEILARNFKTKMFEIDIVSCLDGTVYFTEVKYRRSGRSGDPLEYIDARKLEQMQFAANAFMEFAGKNGAADMNGRPVAEMQPQLAAAAVGGADMHFEEWFPIEA